MRAYGQTTVWGNQIPVGRAKANAGCLQQLWARWTVYKTTRRQAKLAALNGCWDAKREMLIPVRVEAAPEMAAAHGACSVATQLYGLSI